MAETHNLLVELFTEELPPKALKDLSAAFAHTLAADLQAQGVAAAEAVVTPYATPRRLAVHVTQVAAQAPDQHVRTRLMPAKVGLNADGSVKAPLLKKLEALGADAAAVAQLTHESDGKNDMLYYEHVQAGATLQAALQHALEDAIRKLPIPRVMTYQLQHGTPLPGWDSAQFVRPVHGLVALHGADVVPVAALGLTAGRATHGHRFEAQQDPLQIADADSYVATLKDQGGVVASFDDRRTLIASQLKLVGILLGQGWHAVQDDALLDEVTALVERPNVLPCAFDAKYLAVPPECLILTMKANQKYFPLLDGKGQLTHHFVVVSNISPDDVSAITKGNERVVRARLADAEFFYDQDRKQPLASRLPGLAKVVYHKDLGTQAERSERVRAIARAIAALLGGGELAQQADQAAQLAKADLLTGMVGEFPEIQGVMGRYYALNDQLPEAVADAIEDHYKPRFAGDELPRGRVGAVVALADKLETLMGLFGIGALPTGEKDPFALRRHALGVIRILVEQDLALPLDELLTAAANAFAQRAGGSAPFAAAIPALRDFVYDRLRSYAADLSAEGAAHFSTQEIAAAIAPAPQRLAEVPKRLQAVRAFAALPEAPALAAANKRIANILKKSEGADHAAPVNAALLREPAEQALHAALQGTVPQANEQFDAGDYTASLQTLAALRAPVDAFFDQVMVNADDPALRANRLALLQALHAAMNRVADLGHLAV